MNFSRNNLDTASSPYLQQHKDNPVWWQEWTQETLDYAWESSKPIFVSVGYATCHWCHVMARESFQDARAAQYLNDHFVSIKIDREQRPDIDHYLMAYITATGVGGGWPLNAFLTPDLHPMYAMTYAPVEPQYGRVSFIEILMKVKDYYARSGQQVKSFDPPLTWAEDSYETEADLVNILRGSFDPEFGGFGRGTKFPPHTTLVFLLYSLASSGDEKVKLDLEKTLDNMYLRGLHDHLQGGFFRYCVDRKWTIPHFEKMLYDQAMLVWVYSLAFAVFRKDTYSRVVRKLLNCLDETFESQGLYYSGHDADTDHQEGATYLWGQQSLAQVLTQQEYAQFSRIYDISITGNFEGKNHLIRKDHSSLDEIEAILLKERRKRAQPFVDQKFVTFWNCLVGIGFVHAHRYLGYQEELTKASDLAGNLLARHYQNGRLAHSSCAGQLQKDEFLQDYAAMLLFLTYLHEETGLWGEEMAEFYLKTKAFRKEDVWMESFNDDFFPVRADFFDHPTPSSVSLAELACLRGDILKGQDYTAKAYRTPLNHDFFNVMSLLANGSFHVIGAPANLPWDRLPVNSLQKRSAQFSDCYRGACRKDYNW
jgi:uncharacterized protein YyaL (SSP411 family)